MSPATAHEESETLTIIKLGPLGPYANNAFVLVDKASNRSAIIDAVPESDKVLAAADGTTLSMVLFTHSHPDHIASFDELRTQLEVPFYMHADAPWGDHSRIDVHVKDGDAIELGETTIRAIHTPGHTPGSVCYHAAPYLMVGDTLFPGGPGHTKSNDDLQTLMRSVSERIYPLPAETLMFNGHGDDCTVGASKAEYESFAARPHDPELQGDVLWGRD